MKEKGFEGDLDFCSNFYPCEFEWQGVKWQSSEAAYQSAKEEVPNYLEWNTLTPQQAKYKGRRIEVREDWDRIKIKIMESILRCKFHDNPELKQRLIDTGDQKLIEWNWWNDIFWGKSIHRGKGKNHLGKLLMKLRKQYQNEKGE